MSIVTLQGGIRFTTEPGETILNAATRAGINIGYACRNGRCSTCKCTVVSGATRAVHAELGLEPNEAALGQILSCVRTAEGDVSLIADELIPFELPARQILPARIDTLVALAPDVIEVRLRLPPSARFGFLPGQYIDVIGPGGARRSYSLASGSGPQNVVLHIKRVPGGELSEYWFSSAKPDDLLRFSGPLGTFFLRDVDDRHVVFLATGTGIAPVTAMLDGLRQAASPRPGSITVFWGGRRVEDIYTDVAQIETRAAFHPVLSRADASWGGLTGYVQDAFIAADYDLGNCVVYACGSDTMIRSAKHALLKSGIASEDFHSDAFVPSATL
jgi:CDP-4-dehydro-6-deoxyglucose reductase